MNIFKKIARYWASWKKTRISRDKVQELTLYPELPHKKLSRIRKELYWLCKNPKRGGWTMDETISHYFNMGIDREGENVREYIFRVKLDTARNKKQPRTAWLLADKWVTAQHLQLNGIATTQPIMVKHPFISPEETLDKIRKSGKTKFFVKEVDGQQGKGAFSFSICGENFNVEGQPISGKELVNKLENCIIEPFIDQHDALNTLYPHTISSIRIVTICKKNKIEIIITSLCMGAGGSYASNLYQGGIMLNIDKTTGEVGEVAVRTKIKRGRYTSHPDTGVPFKGFKIPYWKEATELAIRAHKCFPTIYSIGWDIAISKTGPLIMEGNSRWVTCPFQFTNGPGKNYMYKYFFKN